MVPISTALGNNSLVNMTRVQTVAQATSTLDLMCDGGASYERVLGASKNNRLLIENGLFQKESGTVNIRWKLVRAPEQRHAARQDMHIAASSRNARVQLHTTTDNAAEGSPESWKTQA
jgi:hypothetical protein